MSQKERLTPVAHLDADKTSNGELSRLAELARQAFERKDTRKCLDLTRAMLLIDPDSADAQRMRSSIQSDIHRDLENARAFLKQVHSKEDSEQPLPSSPSAVPLDSRADSESDNLESVYSPEPAPVPTMPAPSRRTSRIPWLVAAVIVMVLGVLAAGLAMRRTPPTTATLKPEAPANSMPAVKLSDLQPDLLLSTRSAAADLVSSASSAAAPATPAVTGTASSIAPVSTPAPRPAPKSSDRPVSMPDKPVVVAANGTLAISSPTTVDIYKDGAYLASVPVSLELPAGTHTLEYRHGTLSKSVTYVINGNEMTRAQITFDVSVQINSKPWAEVFVDGTAKKSLGQTPLSGVKIPIGTVLIFENPQFQSKKYRVSGNETGIQNIFP